MSHQYYVRKQTSGSELPKSFIPKYEQSVEANVESYSTGSALTIVDVKAALVDLEAERLKAQMSGFESSTVQTAYNKMIAILKKAPNVRCDLPGP